MARNFSWTFAGNACYAACQWLIIVVVARIGSAAMLGEYALGLSISAPVILLLNMQLGGVQATDAQHHFRFIDYGLVRLFTTAVALLTICGIVLFCRFRAEMSAVILIVGTTKAVDALSDIIFGCLQQHEDMRPVGIGLGANGLFSLLAVVVLLAATHSLVVASLGSLCVSVGVLLTYNASHLRATILRTGERLWPVVVNRHVLGELVVMAAPLSGVALCVSLYTNLPRYFIAHYSGNDGLGVFAAVACAMTAGTTVVTAMGQSAVPRLASYWSSQNLKAYKTVLLKLIGVSAALGIAGIAVAYFAGQQILASVYGPQYGARWPLLLQLMSAAAIGYIGSALGYAVNATRAFDRLLLPYTVVLCFEAIACAVLIPRLGLAGAAWVHILTNIGTAAVPVFVFATITPQQSRHEVQLA